jgi:hypothetical protein
MKQYKRLIQYIWFPAILVIWLGLHIAMYAPSPSTTTPLTTIDTNFSLESLNASPVEQAYIEVDIRDVLAEYSDKALYTLWRYAYVAIWLWLVMSGIEYMAQFTTKYWRHLTFIRGVYHNYSFMVLMLMVVVLWP